MARSVLAIALPSICLAALMLACTQSAVPLPPAPIDLATQVEATLQALPTQTASVVPPAPSEMPSATPPPSATPIPSPTPTLTATSELSPTPTASTTPGSGDPRSWLGNPAWQDTFSTGSNWTLGADSFTRAEVEDGTLLFTGLTTMDGWRLTWPEIEDFYLDADLNSGDCEGNDHYGLIFRVPDRHAADEGYLLGFTCDGRYWLRHWGDEKMTTLIPLTSSTAIVAGAQRNNRMGVMADGNQLTLYANGQKLAEIEDETLPDAGGFGLFVGARKSGSLEIGAQEMAYWELP
jgi:hypothetical protein